MLYVNKRLSVFFRLLKKETNPQFESESLEEQTPVCSYWEAGNCARGDQCRFLHDPKV